MKKEKENKITLFGKGEWWKNLTPLDKRVIFGFLMIITITLITIFLIQTMRGYDEDISLNECNLLRAQDVRHYLGLQEENKWLAFIYAFDTTFIGVLIAMSIAWVLHGVGFNLVGGR